MARIDFYTNPFSRGGIIHWALEEVNADYETHLLEYGPQMKSEEYLAINPMGKVPAIVHHSESGPQVVTESAAICAYLAEIHPKIGLLPEASEKAAYFRWLFYAAGPLEAAITNKAMGFTPDEKQSRMSGYGSYELAVQTLEDHFRQHDFVCGSRFTMADVYVGSHVDWGLEFKSLPVLKAFEDYAARVRERSAYKEGRRKGMELVKKVQNKPMPV